MDSFKTKYIHACKQLKIQANDAILHSVRESNKKNQNRDQNFVLDLSGCSISVNDSSVLAKCFATDNFLEEYRFTDCLLCEDSLKIILNALSFNKTIKILDLKGNNLRLSCSELVGKMLKRTALVELYLEWNSLGMCETSLVGISEGLALNGTLRVLDLSNNQISHVGGQEIANALKHNKQLRVLDLRWNNIGVVGGRAILSSLTNNKYIVSLELAGNNIPSDTLKAIATAVKRNIDYHTIYEDHHSKTQSMRQEIDQLQLEKSMQVSTLIDQLEREKEIHNNMSETTRDRLDQMRLAIDDLQNENRYLKEKCVLSDEELTAAKREIKTLTKQQEVSKVQLETIENELSNQKNEAIQAGTREKRECQAELLLRVDEIQALNSEKKAQETKIENHAKEIAQVKDLLKRNETQFDTEKRALQDKHSQDKDDTKADHLREIKVLHGKLSKVSDDKERLEEEVVRLKSNTMSNKLAFEEDMLNQRSKWKHEEALKSKQYEERIELLVNAKDEVQAKLSKASIENADTRTQFVSCQKELDANKRQCEQLQQQATQKDLEYRNENNRIKIELDSEKRITAELRDNGSKCESKMQELKSELKNLSSQKESEIVRLQDVLKCKEDEIRRIRDDEMRRANNLETALQSYINSARSSYKS